MKKTSFILLCCLVAAFLVGCGEWLAKKQQEENANQQEKTAQMKQADQYATAVSSDTIPPVLSQERISTDGMSYIIDTTKCRLTPDEFIKRYPKWLGLNQYNTLKIDTLYTKPTNMNRTGWAYNYTHYFKGIRVGRSSIDINTKNNLVVYIGNGFNLIASDIDVTVNYTSEQVQLMIADTIRKMGIVDSIILPNPKERPTPITPADLLPKPFSRGYLLKPLLALDPKTGTLYYSTVLYVSTDGDVIADKAKDFWVDPKTGKIDISIGYYTPGSMNITYTCLNSYSGTVDAGGAQATLAPQNACEMPPIPLYDACGNAFGEQVNITVPTFGNRAVSCPSIIPIPGIYDHLLSCRNMAITQQNTCNVGEYNYALYRTTTPQLHAYHYQNAGTGNDLYQGNYITFSNNPNYVFSKQILAATSAYWGLDITQSYFADKGINSYDNMGSPIEVVIGRQGTSSAEWKQYVLSGSTPLYIKQILVKPTDNDIAFQYTKLNVMAHEYAHGIIGNYFETGTDAMVPVYPDPQPSQLAKDETAALHESLADIFAILIMDKARQAGVLCNDAADKWLLDVDDIEKRRLNNPTTSATYLVNADNIPVGQAAYYNDMTYSTVLSTYAGNSYLPYYRAGIISYWFYLATEGSTTPVGGVSDISGLGIDAMTNILFATLERCRTAPGFYTPTFADFCQKSIEAANALYPPVGGMCSPALLSVKQAWQAVGLLIEQGEPYPPALIATLQSSF